MKKWEGETGPPLNLAWASRGLNPALGSTDKGTHYIADPELQKRGAKFLAPFQKFRKTFLGIFPELFCIPQKIPSITLNFLMTYFLVIDPFNTEMSRSSAEKAKIHSLHRGPKTLHLGKFTLQLLLFIPPWGSKLRCQFRWGRPWPDWPRASAVGGT